MNLINFITKIMYMSYFILQSCFFTANRKFITFKAKKMKELFGTQKPHKPSYKSLYMKSRNPKEINDRNYRSIIERHQSERDQLFRNQNLNTLNLPKIAEEDFAVQGNESDTHKPHDDTAAAVSSGKTSSTPEEELSRQEKHSQKTGTETGEKSEDAEADQRSCE